MPVRLNCWKRYSCRDDSMVNALVSHQTSHRFNPWDSVWAPDWTGAIYPGTLVSQHIKTTDHRNSLIWAEILYADCIYSNKYKMGNFEKTVMHINVPNHKWCYKNKVKKMHTKNYFEKQWYPWNVMTLLRYSISGLMYTVHNNFLVG